VNPGSDLVERAAQFARTAHTYQLDKQGRDYFLWHLWPIAESLRPHGPEAVAAGYLHDVIEDTDTTAAELTEAFGEKIAGAVIACTRIPGEPYASLIERAAANPLGRLVKLADNAHNLAGNDDLALVDPVKAASLRKRYEKARTVLLAA
jgi:(p)ppGpp synthase/HD superfamily hydrolase